MSSLEKAYLKAMNQEDSEKEAKLVDVADVSVEKRFLDKKTKTSKSLVTSRTDIKKMEQQEVYSPEVLKTKRLISSSMKDTQLLNNYRNLRTKLLSLENKENFIVMVTSVVPSDDSSLISANLAATFALDSTKTATLIDANIHQPTIKDIFDIESDDGLIEFLEDEDWDLEKVLYKTGVPRLRVVPSGLVRENPAEYFTSEKMSQFIHELKTRYPDRFPIINAPSITYSADTRILVDLCDYVVLVIPYGLCSEDDIMKAVISIGNKKLAGVILDNFS